MRWRRGVGSGLVWAPLLLGACAGQPGDDELDGAVEVSAEDVAVATYGEIDAGPLLSGSLQPERSATVLAEISGPVLRVYAEQGQRVAAGAVLLEIDEAALAEDVLSASQAAAAAERSSVLAVRNAERARVLFKVGAISQRQLEDAQLEAETAGSQRADAEARLALARNQLAKATVRSPFAGVVSERPVSAGDVVQPGTHLFTVVDPASMRLEGAVPSTELTFVREGAAVEFEVTGYEGRTFQGRITRVSPTVDPATRQVRVLVSIPNDDGQLVGGLYAEGRLTALSRTALLVPVDAVDLAVSPPTVLRVRSAVVQRVEVAVGLHDEVGEKVEIASGLVPGDTVLVGAARALAPGTQVRVAARAAPTSTSGAR